MAFFNFIFYLFFGGEETECFFFSVDYFFSRGVFFSNGSFWFSVFLPEKKKVGCPSVKWSKEARDLMKKKDI